MEDKAVVGERGQMSDVILRRDGGLRCDGLLASSTPASGSQSVESGPAESSLPEKVFEMQISTQTS